MGISLVPRSYFDDLPIDILETILRPLLQQVTVSYENGDIRLEHGTTTLDMHHPLSLCISDASPFRASVSSMFTELTILEYSEHIFSIERGMITMGLKDIEKLGIGFVRQIFSMCGSSITTITVKPCAHMDDWFAEDELCSGTYSQKLASLPIDHLQNVTEMRVLQKDCTSSNCNGESKVLRKLSSQLTCLVLGQYVSLRLQDMRSCVNIKKLTVAIVEIDELVEILPLIGNALEDIELKMDYEYCDRACLDMLDYLEKHCTRLTRIMCNVSFDMSLETENWGKRYASLLCSYGNQLNEADLAVLNNEQLREVLEKCWNMRIKCPIAVDIDVRDRKRLTIMGPRVESLYLRATWCNGEDWSTVLSKCTSLRVLQVADGRMFSCAPNFPSLRVLRLDDFDGKLDTVLQVASRTSSLRELEVHTRGLIETGTVFQPIVGANRDLCHVDLSDLYGFGRRSSNNALKILSELVNTFSKCRKLEFYVSTFGSITERDVREICGVLPCRGVEASIRIGNFFQYRQTGK